MRRFITGWLASLLVVAAQAGTATYNFDTDPSTTHKITGNNPQPWRATGGKTGGFLAITYPEGSQSTTVVFPDIDAGKIVTAFTFECDLRVGNSAGDRPADGFSVSFARAGDPVIDSGSGFAGGVPEAGTTTGIAISFDTWAGNALPDGADLEGIIVRVDNKTILRQPMPTRHGVCDDATSLQTGPRDAAYWTNGGDPQDPASWAGLCWQPFSIDLDASGKLTVKYKGKTILDKFQTTYFPTASTLVLAGRTGGANENTHFDNIKLTTQAVTPDSVAPTVPPGLASSGVSTRALAFKWNASTDDSGKVAYEIDRDGTIITSTPITATSYFDSAVKPNTSYSYKVRAVDPSGNKSALTAVLTIKTDVETLTPTTGFLTFEAWTDIAGTPVDNLISDAKYAGPADIVAYAGSFDTRTVFGNDSHENYGGRLSGFFTPDQSGAFEFFLRSDDASQLFLSTDDKVANMAQIAEETGCCDAYHESGDPETSAPITMVAGRRYAIQVLWKEGGGGDYAQVAMRKVGDTTAAASLKPIEGKFLSTSLDTKHGPPIISEQPKAVAVALGASATFSVGALGSQPLSYQWAFRPFGQPTTVDLQGENGATFALKNAQESNSGSYSVTVSNFEGSATTVPVSIKLGTPRYIYFVTTDPGPLTFAGDIAVYQRLLKRGFNVELARGSDVPDNGSSALGASLIIQSSSLGSGTVEVGGIGKFRTLAIPAMVWEASNEDAFAFQEANGSTTAAQTQVNIVDATSPLAAGFPKGLVKTSTEEPYSQGTPIGARVVATLADNPDAAVIYSYEKGDKGFGGFVMPARRVFFFFGDNTASVATADGLKLFDAAVDWLLPAAAATAAKFTKSSRNANGSITLEWTGGGTLQASPAVTGPWADVAGATSPYTFTPTAAALFGRVKN